MDFYSETDSNRLFTAVEHSYRAKEPFRRLAEGLVADYVGPGYGKSTSRHERIANLLGQTIDAYTLILAANRPQVLLTATQPHLEYFAKHYSVAINTLIREIGLEKTIKDWILDAFFCVGIIKTHMADAGFVELEQGRWADPGKPFASVVNLDNFVYDMGATRWDQVKFAGDSYRVPFDDLSTDVYDQDAVKDLQPAGKMGTVGNRLDEFSRGQEVDNDELEPMIDLADIWVPREGKIFTFAMDNRHQFQLKGVPIAVMEWTGDEHGPYHLLSFNDVPENIMPTSPASHLATLDRLVNNLYRKQKRQASRQKDVHTYTAAGMDDAKKLQKAEDGEWIGVQDVKDIGLVKQGGVDPSNQAFMLNAIEMFDRMSGNLPAMLGLGAQADTVGQEELIHGAVSKKGAQMQYRVIDATTRLIRCLAKMLWDDQFRVSPGRIPIEGAENYSVDATWTPDNREGDFFDYLIQVDPFSMSYQSPSQRLSALTQLLTQIYVPAMPILMQQGATIDFQQITETYAELMNEPRLKKWIRFNGLPQGEEKGPGDEVPGPTNTTRNYVRRSVSSGGTPQSRSRVAQSEWMGASSQATPQQQATMQQPGAA